jgi:hypothetical protein
MIGLFIDKQDISHVNQENHREIFLTSVFSSCSRGRIVRAPSFAISFHLFLLSLHFNRPE